MLYPWKFINIGILNFLVSFLWLEFNRFFSLVNKFGENGNVTGLDTKWFSQTARLIIVNNIQKHHRKSLHHAGCRDRQAWKINVISHITMHRCTFLHNQIHLQCHVRQRKSLMGGYSWAASSGKDAPENAKRAGNAGCHLQHAHSSWDVSDCGNRDEVWQTPPLCGPGLWSWMLVFPWVWVSYHLVGITLCFHIQLPFFCLESSNSRYMFFWYVNLTLTFQLIYSCKVAKVI